MPDSVAALRKDRGPLRRGRGTFAPHCASVLREHWKSKVPHASLAVLGEVTEQGGYLVRIDSLLNGTMVGAAVLLSCVLVAVAPAKAKSKVNGQNVAAVSGVVSGNVQQVGFRAMIQKLAIEYNLGGLAKNNPNNTVQFTLQGDKDRINQAVAAIRNGTKKSSNVKVSLAPAAVVPNLNTFTVIGWTSVSRNITNPYNLVFTLRSDNTTIKKRATKAVWLQICNKAVKGEDLGKCDKDDD